MIEAAWITVCLLVVWIVVLYPIVVGCLAKWRPGATLQDGDVTCPVDIVVPVRNGDRWIRAKLESIQAQDYPPALIRVLVVSDGSVDATNSTVESISAVDPRICLVKIEASGKAEALNVALRQCDAEIVILTDVRQVLARDCFAELLRPFADSTVGVVSGELRVPAEGGDGSVSLYWRVETALRHALARLDSMLGATGPIYAIRRELTRSLPRGTLLDDMYLPLQAFFAGYRLVSAPRAIAWDEAMDLQTEFGRKVRTMAGNYQLLRLEPRLLSPRSNRMWWHYYSYKLGRLVLPHLILLFFALTWLLPAPWGVALASIQVGGYLFACLDPVFPRTSRLRKVSGPARAMSAMLVAAFLAQKIFFVSAEGMWKPTRTVQ